MSQWRVLVGMDINDPTEARYVQIHATAPTWEIAAGALDTMVRRLRANVDCPKCIQDAEVMLRELTTAAGDEPFTGSIEGYDYALRPA